VTRTGTNHRDRPIGTGATAESIPSGPDDAAEGDAPGPGDGAESHGELVERLRHNAVQLLAGVPRPPRSLRIRAGDVSVDVEWTDEPTVSTNWAVSHRPAPGHASPAGVDGDPSVHYLTAPTVGAFYHAPQPGAPPFVVEGDTVTAGQQVGIVEAMKVMIPVEADADGRVVEVLKGNGEPVEYGERLLALAVAPAPASAPEAS
jgi:acetyl-CoA carboxylase biotin carboxyl carrier protein